jgi:glycogen debranching enzyme
MDVPILRAHLWTGVSPLGRPSLGGVGIFNAPTKMARLGEIPHTPYYGTIDATPLFLILIGRHAAWTGQLTLFDELRGHIDAALEWISKYGDLNGDGYVGYASTSGKGLINQGRKNSGDAIIDADGSLAMPPIALVEVQRYVYLAKRTLAEM